MVELKTLKDLVKEGIVRKGDAYELKAEVIRWIKIFDLKMEWANERMKTSGSCLARVARLQPKPKRELKTCELNMLEDIFEYSFRKGMIRIFNITEKEIEDSGEKK